MPQPRAPLWDNRNWGWTSSVLLLCLEVFPLVSLYFCSVCCKEYMWFKPNPARQAGHLNAVTLTSINLSLSASFSPSPSVYTYTHSLTGRAPRALNVGRRGQMSSAAVERLQGFLCLGFTGVGNISCTPAHPRLQVSHQ